MRLATSNRHHGIPRSFLGSSDDRNISIINAQEHADFHAVAGHLPPDYFLRRMILSVVNWKNDRGKSLPANVFQGFLEELTSDKWSQMYQLGTIQEIDKSETEDDIFLARTAIHIQQQICREQYDTADAFHAICQRQHLSPRRVAFRNAAMDFLGRDSPTEALRRYLLDTSYHDIKWVKPLSLSVRSRLLTLLRKGAPEKPSRHRQRDILDSMEYHRDRLLTCMATWEPRISDFTSVISKHSDIPFFQDYLKRHHSLV